MTVEWDVRQKAIRSWVSAGCQLSLAQVYWGDQDAARPPEPAIELRIYSSHPMGMGWLDFENQAFTFAPVNVSAVSVGQSRLTATAHGFGNGDGPVRIGSTGNVPGGLVTNKDYWVIVINPSTVQFARSFADTGGTPVNGTPPGTIVPITLSSSGTGTITITNTSETVRAGREQRQVSRSVERLGVMLTCYATKGVGLDAAMAILNRLKKRQKLESQQMILRNAGLGLTLVERSRAIHGIRNAVQFEPRAIVEVLFSMPVEEAEDGTVIGSVSGTNLITGNSFKAP